MLIHGCGRELGGQQYAVLGAGLFQVDLLPVFAQRFRFLVDFNVLLLDGMSSF